MPRCLNCGGAVCLDYDGFEEYYTCINCSRQFGLDMKPRRMTPIELKSRYGIKLTEKAGKY